MKMRQKEQGITLVALIVTIIILIILAAVTIFAVTKNNFVGLATAGTQNYAEAQVDESTKMDDLVDKLEVTLSNIESIQTQGGGTGGGDTPPTPEEPEKPPVELPAAGTAVPTEGWSVEVAKGLVARDGLAAHLGEKVDYNPPAGGTWRIFYYDNEDGPDGNGYFGDGKGTLYLKRDYDSDLQTALTLITEEDSSDGLATMRKMNPMWAESDNASALDHNNEKAVAWLCDPDKWKQYVTGEGKYAIGSPSLEMLLKASNIYSNNNPEFTVDCTSPNGYLLGPSCSANRRGVTVVWTSDHESGTDDAEVPYG